MSINWVHETSIPSPELNLDALAKKDIWAEVERLQNMCRWIDVNTTTNLCGVLNTVIGWRVDNFSEAIEQLEKVNT